MQPIKINITKPLSKGEFFFLQKSVELLYSYSLDTYRLRINNPKTILQEISQVLILIDQGSIREYYGRELFLEALDLLKSENELKFLSINKGYLLNTFSKNDLKIATYLSNIVLKENKDYAEILFQLINEEIQIVDGKLTYDFKDYDRLNRLINYFLVELKSNGYSKQYLHKFFRSIFFPQKPAADFISVFQIIHSLIDRPQEKFTIYVAFELTYTIDPKLISDKELIHIDYADLLIEAEGINKLFRSYVAKNSNWTYFKIEVLSSDYLSAGYIARHRLQQKLDLLFMGFSSKRVLLNNHCFVIGEKMPERGRKQYLDYELDGEFASNEDTYNKFLQNINGVESKPLDPVSFSKIKAGLRYLRLGSHSDELESKLLNYWIAIEYLFSSFDAEQDKVGRLREYYKKIHSLSYATRIIQYTHKCIVNLDLAKNFSKFDVKNPIYVTDAITLTEAEALISDYPLLVYRLKTINDRFKDAASINNEINRHQKNLERNIIRIYRSRNEIVHNAVKDKNIIDITSHLKYYLIFVINGFIHFVNNNPTDLNKDGKISIDDYFLLSSIQLDSLLIDPKVNIEKLLQFENPVEYLN